MHDLMWLLCLCSSILCLSCILLSLPCPVCRCCILYSSPPDVTCAPSFIQATTCSARSYSCMYGGVALCMGACIVQVNLAPDSSPLTHSLHLKLLCTLCSFTRTSKLWFACPAHAMPWYVCISAWPARPHMAAFSLDPSEHALPFFCMFLRCCISSRIV